MMGETFTSRRRVASCRTSIGIVFVVYGWVLEFGFRSFAARRGNSEGRIQGGCAVILTSVPHHDRSRRLWRRLVQDPGALRAHSGEQKSHDRSGRESQSPGNNGGSAHNCFCFFHNETPPPLRSSLKSVCRTRCGDANVWCRSFDAICRDARVSSSLLGTPCSVPTGCVPPPLIIVLIH